MINFGLLPCPLCGGEPEVARLTQGPGELTAVIKCTDCGLTLEWETDIKVGVSRSGKHTQVKAGLDPIEAWNRRPHNDVAACDLCETCSNKIYADQVAALPNCNDCGAAAGCDYMPKIGQHARINCPLWRPMEADQ